MNIDRISSDADIELLIHCPKVFLTKPKKPVITNRNVTQRFSVHEKDSSLEFDIFFSYSEQIPQDFSLGLMCGNMLLFRCNGFHGTTRSGFFSAPHHAYPHSHKLSVEDIKNGRSRKPSIIEDLTGKYVSFQTAIVFFCEECGIMDYEKYFPVTQLRLADI